MNRGGQPPPQSKNELTPNQKTLNPDGQQSKTATDEMKLFKMTFAALGILAAIAIALGAYWHIITLGICAAMVNALKTDKQ